jgi:hypothetical protein
MIFTNLDRRCDGVDRHILGLLMQTPSNYVVESSNQSQGSIDKVQEDRTLIPDPWLIDDSIPLL